MMKASTAIWLSALAWTGSCPAAFSSPAAEVEIGPPGDQVAHQTQSRPALGEGVFIAGGRQTDCEQTGQRVQPVDQPDQQSSPAGGGGISREARQVVLEDRLRDLRRLAGVQGVIAPDDPLQGGHLDHHFGRQVGLAQCRRAAGIDGLIRIQTQHGGNILHQRLQAVDLIQHRTQLGLEGQRIQLWQVGFQRLLEIFAYEVSRVRETRPDDMLVAFCDHVQSLPIPIAHGDKIGQQFPLLLHREVALVLLHHRDQHIAGQLQVRGVKRAAQRPRGLYQISDFLQQGRVWVRPARRPRQPAPNICLAMASRRCSTSRMIP